jgi:hypothetical protein
VNFSALSKEFERRTSAIVSALRKQAPGARKMGKFADDQAAREVKKILDANAKPDKDRPVE